jgi:predicted RNase H-like HicB family nuclease
MTCKVDVIIERDQDGYYAYCPAMEGCQSQGETFEQVLENIEEAIELYWETLTPEEIETLRSTRVITTSIEVAIA